MNVFGSENIVETITKKTAYTDTGSRIPVYEVTQQDPNTYEYWKFCMIATSYDEYGRPIRYRKLSPQELSKITTIS